MEIIPVFFSFDNGYVPQAAVTFESLLTNRKNKFFYELKVLYTEISENNQLVLKELVDKHPNTSLDFILLEKSLLNLSFDNTNFSTGHLGTVFTIDTLFRCVPDLIPELNKYEKIIYSDVDIVIVDDISELNKITFTNEYLAGVKIPSFLEHEIKHLPEKFKGKYFAGGLWVMNLKKMREDKIGEKAIALMKNPPFKLLWNDQDVMNLVCDTNVLYLPYKYISIPDWLPMLKKIKFKDKYYPNKELYDCMYSPKIVHYAGKKPWKDVSVLKADLWFDWLDKTPFSNLFDDKKNELKEKSKVNVFNKLLKKLRKL
ncbi:glycosyltransferase family 8 protein [Tenacibaculum sp. 190524A02b]|uniref:glycosyltransferase family 8 protein n=1 Tax=Tenacibaculum vairaonense TaxID=3137860 RepID=UPI0031FB3DFF